ncbi:MAG: hypothetical protein QOG10_1105, partial [Kribbellaceae bacterium]|nr:hypothetical protein [Kribbellaceae bacterium]
DSVTPKQAVTSSPDGRSLAYVTDSTETALWTRRVDPSGLGTALKLWASQSEITHLSWSPDGSRIAFQAPEAGGSAALPCVFVIPSTGGTPEKIACDVSSPSWMPDARTLVVIDNRLEGDHGYLARIEAKPGGSRLKTFGTQLLDGSPVRVSPDGRYVAIASGWGVSVIGAESNTDHSSPTFDSSVISISWSPGGGQLLVLTETGRLTKIDVAADGNLKEKAPVTLWTGSPQENRFDVAWQRLGLMIKPTAAVMGRQVSIPFDSSALLPGATFSCYLSSVLLPSCASPVTTTITSSGSYTLEVLGTEPGGRQVSATRPFTVDATGPVTRIVSPTYEASTTASATVQYAATDASGATSYDVRYRTASYLGTFGAYVQPWTNTIATSVSLNLTSGYEYCVSARARDKLGNLGAWSAERCFSRPMDDRALAAPTAGWTRASGSGFYLGTATHTTTYGASLTRTVQGKRFYLVATRCSTCGVISVYLGGKYIGAVNLWASTTQRQAVISLPAQSSVFSGTLTIATRSTGKLIQIDGLAVRRA